MCLNEKANGTKLKIVFMLHTNHSMHTSETWDVHGLMFWSTIAILLQTVVMERVVKRTWIKKTQGKKTEASIIILQHFAENGKTNVHNIEFRETYVS